MTDYPAVTPTYWCPRCEKDLPQTEFTFVKTYYTVKRGSPVRVLIVKHKPCRWDSAVLRTVRERATQRRAAS